MQLLYYTIAGVVLYWLADGILRLIESRRGAAFEHRTLIFFFILLALALVSFQAIQHFLGPDAPR